MRFAASASRTCGGRNTASVSKPASASISIAARSAGGVLRSMITHQVPFDLAQPSAARGIAGHRVVANLDAELRGGLLQSLRHLLGLHWLGSSSSVSVFCLCLSSSRAEAKFSWAERSRSMIWAPPT